MGEAQQQGNPGVAVHSGPVLDAITAVAYLITITGSIADLNSLAPVDKWLLLTFAGCGTAALAVSMTIRRHSLTRRGLRIVGAILVLVLAGMAIGAGLRGEREALAGGPPNAPGPSRVGTPGATATPGPSPFPGQHTGRRTAGSGQAFVPAGGGAGRTGANDLGGARDVGSAQNGNRNEGTDAGGAGARGTNVGRTGTGGDVTTQPGGTKPGGGTAPGGGSRSTPGTTAPAPPPPLPPDTTAPPVLDVTYPRSGDRMEHLASSEGAIGNAAAGMEIWALTRAGDGEPFYAQGPCTSDGQHWGCSSVPYRGGDVVRPCLLRMVVVDAETGQALALRRGSGLVELPRFLSSTDVVVKC